MSLRAPAGQRHQDRIASALEAGPATYLQLACRTGLTPRAVSSVLHAMRLHGLVTIVSRYQGAGRPAFVYQGVPLSPVPITRPVATTAVEMCAAEPSRPAVRTRTIDGQVYDVIWDGTR